MLCKVYRGGQHAQPTAWPNVDPASAALLEAGVRSHSGPASGSIMGDASQEEIARTIAQVKQQAEAEIRKTQDTAFAAGRQAAAAEVNPVLQRLARSIEDLAMIRTTLRKQAEEDLVRLSIEIARRILHREINADPAALHGVVSHVLSQMTSREVCSVRIHPDHASALERHFGAGAGRIRLVPDPSLAHGDVLVESDRGTLDASVSSQLLEIERGFIERLA